jgi:multisubunit Na+/H+ antiporter MnhF subunit
MKKYKISKRILQIILCYAILFWFKGLIKIINIKNDFQPPPIFEILGIMLSTSAFKSITKNKTFGGLITLAVSLMYLIYIIILYVFIPNNKILPFFELAFVLLAFVNSIIYIKKLKETQDINSTIHKSKKDLEYEEALKKLKEQIK